MIPVAILGGSGYTAVELIKIFLRHPQVEIRLITSTKEGTPAIEEMHPSLLGRLRLNCEPFSADRFVELGIQCAFGCLPHGVSIACVQPLIERGIRVIDLSADYRLRDPQQYQQWYEHAHADTANLQHAVYGLPEIYGEKIAKARLIANPGCYPQTAILGLAPLLARGYIHPKEIIVNSLSGVSGAGRTPKLNTLFPECNESISAYNIGKHRHTPEIEQVLTDIAGQPVEVIFSPHLAPMDRGIFSTIYATPLKADWNESALLELYSQYYANAPFVRVRKNLPSTKDVAHTNFLDLTIRVVKGKIIVLVVEDTLIRGASGVAVQNFNRLFGFPETMGLL